MGTCHQNLLITFLKHDKTFYNYKLILHEHKDFDQVTMHWKLFPQIIKKKKIGIYLIPLYKDIFGFCQMMLRIQQ